MTQVDRSARKLELAGAYAHYRKMSDTAFREKDGALSCGAAATAYHWAEVFRQEFGLANTDQAVAEIRRLLR